MPTNRLILELNKDRYKVIISNDDTYNSGSADNLHSYDKEYLLGEDFYRPSSQHSVTIRTEGSVVSSCILAAVGGATGIHEHSAIICKDSCIIAVGPFMCSLLIPSLDLEWKAEVDDATCFGVYFSEKHNCFISHGELDIARVEHGAKYFVNRVAKIYSLAASNCMMITSRLLISTVSDTDLI
jgi:hypothetical protein